MPNPAQTIAAKTMGVAKATKAMIQGLHGVFRKLTQEHGEVSALMMRLKHSSDIALRSELFPIIRRELLAHERSEKKVVYPILREHADTLQIAAQHNQETLELEEMIAQLSALSVQDPAWPTQFATLVETVERHAEEEEQIFFPTAQRVLGEGVADALKPRYEAAKAEILPTL